MKYYLDLEWKVIYVGNAEDDSGDQLLEEVMVGPVSMGINRFVLQAKPPNQNLISNQDLIGVTVVLINCSFMDNKFVQIGYYVNNEYSEPFEPENYPNPVEINKIFRNILADQPRVTRFAIDWTGDGNLPAANEEPKNGDDEDLVDFDEEENNNNEEEEEEENEEDDDDEDIEVEVDLEAEEGGEGEGELLLSMEVMNEDSNSMDIERMLQH
jgi:histone chaperone ASF1